jgi:hypothetical protein
MIDGVCQVPTAYPAYSIQAWFLVFHAEFRMTCHGYGRMDDGDTRDAATFHPQLRSEPCSLRGLIILRRRITGRVGLFPCLRPLAEEKM